MPECPEPSGSSAAPSPRGWGHGLPACARGTPLSPPSGEVKRGQTPPGQVDEVWVEDAGFPCCQGTPCWAQRVVQWSSVPTGALGAFVVAVPGGQQDAGCAGVSADVGDHGGVGA